MRGRRIGIVAIVAVVGTAGVVAQQGGGVHRAPARDVARTGTSPAGRIIGRVITDDTGAPVIGVEVMAFLPGSRSPSAAVRTDPQGRYEVDGLAAGDYQMHAEKTGFVAASRRVALREPALADREQASSLEEIVDFRLSRPGGIAGTITDEHGSPVPNAVPHLLQREWSGGEWKMTNVPGMNVNGTDDRGEFRLHGLLPGRYYLIASPPGDARAARGGAPSRGGPEYAPVYYPGTTDITLAAPLTVAAGQTVQVNLMLDASPCARVSGTVIGGDGAPMRGAQMFMRPLQSSISRNVAVDPNGRFSVPMVPPGKYVLQASPLVRRDAAEVSFATIVVGRTDVTSVTVAPVRPATGRGRLVGDPRVLQAFAAAGGRVVARSENRLIAGRALEARLREDMTFDFLAWPGRAVVTLAGAPSSFCVRAVRVGGVDVTARGIEFGDGRDVSDIEVEVTNRPAQLQGTVRSTAGTVIRSAAVIVFTTRSDDWFATLARPNLDGRFAVWPLAPGEYFAVAVSPREIDEPGRWTDPALLRRLRASAVRFSVAEGETTTVRLVASAGK